MTTDLAAIRGTTASPRPLPAAERRFYSGYALALLATVLVGFAQTYYLRPLLPAPARALRPLSPLLHVHGLLFTGWMLLLVAQTRLVAARRVDLHRRVGVAGGLLAVAMVVFGVLAALNAVLRGTARPESSRAASWSCRLPPSCSSRCSWRPPCWPGAMHRPTSG